MRETNTSEQKEANVDTEIQEKVTQRIPDREDKLRKGTKEFPERTEKLWTLWKRTSTLLKQLCCTGSRMQKMSKKKGHFAAVCRSGRVGAVLEEEEEDTLFLGAVSTEKKLKTWKKTLKVNGLDITPQVGYRGGCNSHPSYCVLKSMAQPTNQSNNTTVWAQQWTSIGQRSIWWSHGI